MLQKGMPATFLRRLLRSIFPDSINMNWEGWLFVFVISKLFILHYYDVVLRRHIFSWKCAFSSHEMYQWFEALLWFKTASGNKVRLSLLLTLLKFRSFTLRQFTLSQFSGNCLCCFLYCIFRKQYRIHLHFIGIFSVKKGYCHDF